MIIRAGMLYDGSLDEPRRNADVVIRDGTIAEIRDASGECDREAACVTPGLVNAHVHLVMSGEANITAALAVMSPGEMLLRAVENAQRSLRAGVTTVRDLGAPARYAIEVANAVNEGRIAGPRISAAGAALCMTGGHGWFVGREVDGPWDARKAVREQRRDGADCIKLIATGGVLTKGAVPGVAQLMPEELEAACEEAHAHGMRAAAHAIGTQGIKNALRAGIDSIEHGHMLDDEAIALFKERDAYLVPTLNAPACILQHAEGGGQPDFVVRKADEVNAHAERAIRAAFEAGVKIAGGSDAGTPFNAHDAYAEEIMLMHRLLGMSPRQALHAATAVAAELIGLHRGILAPGEPADLLLLSDDVDGHLGTLANPVAVYKAGALVV